MVTEFGRQPWVIYGVLRTDRAITTAPGLGAIFAGFALVYVVLSAITVWLLRRLATRSAGRPLGPLRTGGGGMTLADGSFFSLIAVIWKRPSPPTRCSAAPTSAPGYSTSSPPPTRTGAGARSRSPPRSVRPPGRPTTCGSSSC